MKCQIIFIPVERTSKRAICSCENRCSTQCDWALVFLAANGGDTCTEQGRANHCKVVDAVAITGNCCFSRKVEGQIIAVADKRAIDNALLSLKDSRANQGHVGFIGLNIRSHNRAVEIHITNTSQAAKV